MSRTNAIRIHVNSGKSLAFLGVTHRKNYFIYLFFLSKMLGGGGGGKINGFLSNTSFFWKVKQLYMVKPLDFRFHWNHICCYNDYFGIYDHFALLKILNFCNVVLRKNYLMGSYCENATLMVIMALGMVNLNTSN